MPEDLSIFISAPIKHGKRVVELSKPQSYFHVVIRNNSAHMVEFWNEESSWGFNNLSFEVSGSDKETSVLKKKDQEWDKNFPDHFSVEPNGYFVMTINFKDGSWQGLPEWMIKKQGIVISLISIFNVSFTPEAVEHDIWVGKIISDKKEFVFWA